MWSVQADSFSTFPRPFTMIASTDPALYKVQREADLLIFKESDFYWLEI